MLRRLELPDGQWADLLVKPRHAEYVAVLEAAETGSGVLWRVTLGRQFCKAWMVRDEEGSVLDVKDWNRADPDITDAVCLEALNRWKEWESTRVPLVTPRTPSPRAGTPGPSSDAGSEESPS